MTKSLLVNCSLKATANEVLLEAIKKFSDVGVVHFRDVDEGYHVEKDVECVVISGSAARIVNSSHRHMFSGVVNLIKTCSLPILGVCYGHQLLCWTLGANVGSLPQPVEKFEKVRVVDVDEIFADFAEQETIPLAENHYDYVLKESLDQAGMVLLADSVSCEVEAVKHKSKPFYSVQFHPERITIKKESHSEGHRIIGNFYSNVVKR